MRTLEAVWEAHAALVEAQPVFTTPPEWVVLLGEYRRWTEEQRRINVGLIVENKDLRRRVAELERGTRGAP